MSGFLAVAGALTLLALIALLFPLLRRREGMPEAWRSGGLAAVLIVIGAAALYPLWSSFKWHEPEPAADSPTAMVGRLARRLEKEPNDLDGWLLLGRSYSVIQQFPLAARAYQRADSLADGKNADAAMGLAEALVNSGRSDLSGRAGRLFEQALALDGNSIKALFYSALAASERNELPLAKQRFTRLLDGNPPPEVKRLIEEHIKALDGMMLMAAAGPQAAPQVAAAAAAATTQPAAQPAASSSVVTVPLRVTIAPGVAAKAAAGVPLFVLARIPGQRGPPIAVQRLSAKFPQDVDLRSSDAMVAGTGFTAGQEIEIEARVANGGGAISVTGDPFGTVRVKAGGAARTSLEINQLKP
jgi:cytochrome c-type biogenesis protein CcmH